MYHKQNNEPELTIDDLMVKLFKEVEYVGPKLGNPPLVTPFSQYVKNVALMNVFNMERGEGRWQAIDKNTWGMITGKSGKLPGTLAPEIIELAKEKGEEFTDANPQDYYPDELDKYRKIMDEEGWDYGQDDEEPVSYTHLDVYKRQRSISLYEPLYLSNSLCKIEMKSSLLLWS